MRGSCVLCGNIVINTENLRVSLKKQEYYMYYEEDKNKVTINTDSGRLLFELSNIPYESAAKLAEGLGLKGRSEPTPTTWSKWNPSLSLDHDGSADADLLWMEMLKLGIPHKIHRGKERLVLYANQGGHDRPMWSIEKMLKIIRDDAERYQEQLTSTP
ncbi:MAG: hypothetical protein HY226_02510 [Candidatus Vogelbacteria bacterium]|nr:hypothetical protein [Candidatus Vogelbacteria bacterium]